MAATRRVFPVYAAAVAARRRVGRRRQHKPVEDVLVDGKQLEGIGVEPTIAFPFDRRYAAGADRQLDRAVDALSPS